MLSLRSLLVLPLLLALTPSAAAWQATGTVIGSKKISQLGSEVFLPLDIDDQLGRGVAVIGDLDGDGRPELAVGAQNDDDGGTSGTESNKGAVWILSLDAASRVRWLSKISATRGNFTGRLDDRDQFGRTVASLGDWNLDGIPDIAVGAARDDDGGNNFGAIWLLFLDARGAVKEHRKIGGTSGGFTGQLEMFDEFGRSIALIDDLDGDGVDELAVGAIGDNDGGWMNGAVYVLFMRRDGTVKRHTKISELSGNLGVLLRDGDIFGMAIANVGDLDDDGVPDIVVGAPKDKDGGAKKGAVYVLRLRADGTVKATQKISALAGGFVGPLGWGDEFGTAISRLGDLNGDGVEDLAVGAMLDDGGGTSKGAVWILFLNQDGTVEAQQKINAVTGNFPGPLDAEDWFGTAIDLLPDLNGDGMADIVVGARFDDDGDMDAGCVYTLMLQGTRNVPPTVGFDASPRVGAAPLTVAFADASSAGATSWLWDFGDGTTSTARDPQKTYGRVGAYTVRLTATGPGGTGEHTHVGFIDVKAPADAAIAASPTRGFTPLTVAFTDLSTGYVSAWSWRFGDGTTSNERDPVHVYTQAGTYSVTLTVRGGAYTDSTTEVGLIYTHSPIPGADFIAGPTQGIAPLFVQFTDTSSGSVTSWAWNFGDGTTSNARSPVHVFTSPGSYSISLTVSGPSGSDTKQATQLVTVLAAAPVADFGATPVRGFAPLSVAFSDASSGSVTAWTWSFGDGTTAQGALPRHTYGAPGKYSVGLTVSGPGGSDALTRIGFVEVLDPAPVSSFYLAPSVGFAPLSVSFSDRSAGLITSWSWDFGDGASSTLANPTHVYTLPGKRSVALRVAGPAGASTTVLKDVVHVTDPTPVASFTADLTSGPAPLTVRFTDTSTGNVTSRAWQFGDGTSSTELAPVHVYQRPGSYTVRLLASGPTGSNERVQADFVRVGEAVPVAAFSMSRSEGFAPLEVVFTDTSAGAVTGWTWDFGDGAGASGRTVSHVYTTPGTYTPSLGVVGPGGRDALTLTGQLRVFDPTPVASFVSDRTRGYQPLAVAFQDVSAGQVTTRAWSFGDGESSSAANPIHVYARPGSYTVSLTVAGPTGADTRTKSAFIVVEPLPNSLRDASFEEQLAGALPGAPWTVLSGGEHAIVRQRDGAMPSEGLLWCELSAAGTSASRPPSSPGGITVPPSGGAGIAQAFVYPAGQSELAFEAAFLRDGNARSQTFNDWMSVDVSDGATSINVYYRDTYSPTIGLSTRNGLPMTAVETIAVDLAVLFPLSTPTTVFTLTAQVGNGGDDLFPSKGWVDDFRFRSSARARVFGSGVNPRGSMIVVRGLPRLGTAFDLGLDNPLGTQAAGAATLLWFSVAPDRHHPAGTLVPRTGMAGGAGELLIGMTPPDPVAVVNGPTWEGTGAPALFHFLVPDDVSLLGQRGFAQGLIWDRSRGAAVRLGLTEALEIVVGP